tara:strand:- start:810 stop:1547 length:738 start_codon:yes stop_codon:yes gene_type:complete
VADNLTYKGVWETLSKVDVSDHTEKKMNLTYLSWAWAWGVLMEHYPEAKYSFYEDDNHVPFVTLPDGTCEVRCRVSIGDLVREMWLPIMNHKNQPVINPNSFQVNTSKMRCLTKCLGMWGLGHYIYAGEDLPDGEAKEEKPVGKKPVPKKTPVKEEPKKEESVEEVKDDFVYDEKWAEAFVEGFVKTLAVCNSQEEVAGLYKANPEQIGVLKDKFADQKKRLDAFSVQHVENLNQKESSEEVKND